MNTTETKLEEVDSTVSKYEATQTWQFYRCDECNGAASSPSNIVHELHCSQYEDEQ